MKSLINKSFVSPNFGERKSGRSPSMIILHYTNMTSVEAAIDRLCDPEAEVSAHYVVARDGQIFQLVENDKRAWHAGKAYWRGITDINSYSIGIELENTGHDHGYLPFTDEQMAACLELCQSLMKQYEIKPNMVLGHSDVSPSNPDKMDPGHLFPWKSFAEQGVGGWPDVDLETYDEAKTIARDQDTVHQKLIDYGYDPSVSFEEIWVDFCRHFYPEGFETYDDMPDINLEAVARLLALSK